MGEKGNLTSEELLAAASAGEASGLGAVVAGAGTTVTAVFHESADSLKDKIIDAGVDAGVSEGHQRLRENRGKGSPEGTEPAP